MKFLDASIKESKYYLSEANWDYDEAIECYLRDEKWDAKNGSNIQYGFGKINSTRRSNSSSTTTSSSMRSTNMSYFEIDYSYDEKKSLI